MNGYERPELKDLEGAAEGVFMASGSVGGTGSTGGSDVIYMLERTQTGDQWNKVDVFTLTVTNNSAEELRDWEATLYVTSGTMTGAQVYNGWLASASMSGNKVVVTPGGGGAVGAGASIKVEVVVSYSSDGVVLKVG